MHDSTLTPELARNADDVDRLAARLYDLPGRQHWDTGVLHPTSVWRGPRGDAERPMTLRIGEETPVSPWDLFALGLARARADAIVTSGRILRAEPGLRHDLPGQELPGKGDLPAALLDWRRRSGKSRPPLSLVMSLSGDIDFAHPFFSGDSRIVIYTSEAGAWRLDSRAADAGVEVQAAERPTPRGAIEFARGAFGCATISIEAGPSIARGLYEDPIALDEVLLSTYLGEALPTAARGGRQVSRQDLEGRFSRLGKPCLIRQDPGQDGAWRFERFSRRR